MPTAVKKKLTPAEKRIAVAKDVLRSLRLRRVRIVGGKYLEPRNGYAAGRVFAAVQGATDLGEAVDVIEKNCEMCLLGVCLLAKARLFDRVPASAYIRKDPYLVTAPFFWANSDTINDHLQDVFSDSQMRLMEEAFEGFCDSSPMGGAAGDATRFAGNLGLSRAKKNRPKIVAAVMKNVIYHGGQFVPGDYQNKNRAAK